ncbi:conserved hypothetical protein [Synechococcus sp. PCC 7335]|uniref:LabA-like NYN domain-containing protein n=1 Tax=Synechococcus sp. (strain ATCC 29403 / PCC 7335) TaxID=91464 RepID=UPI00017EC366|nr:NYN domain-containing protein [Synechococcus sp. PCC 7335]EDX83759.1 conserved hypothetical protein [Synechococcus sp. PCC 7335]
MKISDTNSAKTEVTPQSDMRKADERNSRDANQNEMFNHKADAIDSSVVRAETELEVGVDEFALVPSTSLAPAPSKEITAQSSDKPSSTDVARKARSRRKIISKPSTPSRPPSSDFSSKRSSDSASSPEPPKTSSRKRARDTTANSLKLDRKTSKSQPNLSENSQAVVQSNDLITIFIDGSNLFYAASHLNIEVDYRRLLTSLVRGRRLLRAYFYTGVDPQNEKQRGFLLWLNRHGHRVVSKELTNLPDGSRKANMHVEMAVDMMRISEYCSNITLLGGDGNLAYALQVLSQRGTFIEVVSLQSMTSDSLIDIADSYTDLADLRDRIKR